MAKKILVVDDNEEDINTIKSILEKEGYEVVAVGNGADALDNLTSDGIGLVLIDIKMPTLSGYDLLRLAREKVNNNVPMIYITIVPQKEVDMDSINGFIQKPFTPETLVDEVKKHI